MQKNMVSELKRNEAKSLSELRQQMQIDMANSRKNKELMNVIGNEIQVY